MYKILTGMDFIAFIVIYMVYFRPKWYADQYTYVVKTIIYIYLVFVFYFTIMPLFIPIPLMNLDISYFNINLMPFRDFILGYGGALKQLLLNILMLIPFGFLVPMIRKTNLFAITIYSFFFSLSIETIQLLSPRKLNSFDVTDLIANTVGGLIGYFIFIIFYPWLASLSKRLFDKTAVRTLRHNTAFANRVVFAVIAGQLLIRSILLRFI